MIELTMPKLSESMEAGTIITWLKADGDRVEAGEDLFEVETDKATVTCPAESAGILTIIAPEGTTLLVGAPIAGLDTADAVSDEEPAVDASNGGAGPAPDPIPTSAAHLVGYSEGGDGARVEPDERPSALGGRTTPLARRAAEFHGVSLQGIVGSGPLGRIVRADVLAKAGLPPAPSPLPGPRAAPAGTSREVRISEDRVPLGGTAKGQVEVVEPSRLQALAAQRMANAKATIPHFQVQAEIAMDAAVGFRSQIKGSGVSAPSYNDLVVKAAALALREHPVANGSYQGGRFELYSRINIGIAVAADEALVVPTIFDADKKSLGTLAAEARRLAERVRNGSLTPAELSGATFTVSNLGMYGMSAITPVINPPQATILGVGAMRDVLGRVGEEIVDRQVMTLTLSCDHRILNGAQAARFLSTIRDFLERPARLAL